MEPLTVIILMILTVLSAFGLAALVGILQAVWDLRHFRRALKLVLKDIAKG